MLIDTFIDNSLYEDIDYYQSGIYSPDTSTKVR